MSVVELRLWLFADQSSHLTPRWVKHFVERFDQNKQERNTKSNIEMMVETGGGKKYLHSALKYMNIYKYLCEEKKNNLVNVKVRIQFLYSDKIRKVQVLKCTEVKGTIFCLPLIKQFKNEKVGTE